MKKENLVISVFFGLLAIAVIVNGIIVYFDAITFVIAGLFVVLAVVTATFETICEKIEEKTHREVK